MPKITQHDGANPPKPKPVSEVETVNYGALTKSELVALADERGLDSSGTKAELSARLEADDGLADTR